MRDVDAKGCSEQGSPRRLDLPLHDFMGGNTFVTDIVPTFFPDEVDVAQLDAAKDRALTMLQLAATLEVTPEDFGITVRVTNETGHKLPSGYPEGRRIWLNVAAVDGAGQQVFESGTYDFEAAELAHDEQAKIYEIHPGLSPSLAQALGLPAGESFHFVINDTVYLDNRIPPRGFTNAGFEGIQSPPVAYGYVNGQYWDDSEYLLPLEAETVTVTLYYQTTSKEYVEFLRDENRTNSAGQNLYDAWVAQGKGPPVVMAQVTTPVNVTVTTDLAESETAPRLVYGLSQNFPNPFNPVTGIAYSLPEKQRVNVSVYDVSGRRVRTLVDETQDPGRYNILWYGRDDRGGGLAAGVYLIRYQAGEHVFSRKAILLK